MSTREEQMIKVQQEGFSLFQKKNKDYGDAFAKYGPVGVLMRMGDKISRLQSITKSGIVLVDDEKVRDTLIDLHNYAAMGIMLLDEGGEFKIKENDEESEEIEENEKKDAKCENNNCKKNEISEINELLSDVDHNVKHINILLNNIFIAICIWTFSLILFF
jgi:hypothetical protein